MGKVRLCNQVVDLLGFLVEGVRYVLRWNNGVMSTHLVRIEGLDFPVRIGFRLGMAPAQCLEHSRRFRVAFLAEIATIAAVVCNGLVLVPELLGNFQYLSGLVSKLARRLGLKRKQIVWQGRGRFLFPGLGGQDGGLFPRDVCGDRLGECLVDDLSLLVERRVFGWHVLCGDGFLRGPCKFELNLCYDHIKCLFFMRLVRAVPAHNET